jgi:hypothetical protein
MKYDIRIFFLFWSCVGMLCSSGSVAAGELGHYMPGVAGVRDFVVPPEPGFYYAQYNLYYAADTYNDRNGNEVDSVTIGPITLDVDAEVDAFTIQPTFIWSTDKEIFGARYAVYAGIPIARNSFQASLSTTTRFGVGTDESNWGLGDIYLRPIWLGWNSKHFGTSIGYGFYAPTGKYDDGEADNTGLGFWTHEFQAGVTWHPWEHQGTAVMVTGTYEIHHKKDDVDITPGDRFSLDWGVSQFLPLNKDETLLAEMGISGYSQWQVNSDSGSAVVAVLNVEDEVHGIGGQIGLTSIPLNGSLVFRYLKEYDAEARFEGELFVLTIAKGF